MYVDKRYYPCVVLSESEDKDQLIKTKNVIHLTAKKQGGSSGSARKEKKDKQAGEKNKRKGPSVSNDQTQEDKLKTVKEKEEKKMEKNPKKKALDERDLNVLGQMSQLNRSIVIVDKLRRDTEGKEKELERKRGELERREKEYTKERTCGTRTKLTRKERTRGSISRNASHGARALQGGEEEEEDKDDKEYDEENFDLRL